MSKHEGRTRAERKTLTAPMTVAELAAVDAAAKLAGLTRAEYVRRAVRETSTYRLANL